LPAVVGGLDVAEFEQGLAEPETSRPARTCHRGAVAAVPGEAERAVEVLTGFGAAADFGADGAEVARDAGFDGAVAAVLGVAQGRIDRLLELAPDQGFSYRAAP
jgi:hypothetical protein